MRGINAVRIVTEVMDLKSFGNRATELLVEEPVNWLVLAADSYLPVASAQTCLPKPAACLFKLIDPVQEI